VIVSVLAGEIPCSLEKIPCFFEKLPCSAV